MLAHTQKYFSSLLQIYTFIKLHSKNLQYELPQLLKLMTFAEFHENILHDKYETSVIRQLFIFILHHTHNPQFAKHEIGATHHFLVGTLSKYKYQIISHYYLPIAIQQYLLLTQSQENPSSYINTCHFYSLPFQFKIKLLSTLVTNANRVYIKSKLSGSKNGYEETQSTKSTDNKSKENEFKITEGLVLGQDNKKLYFFFECIPEYILSYELGKWEPITKEQTIELIKKILLQTMSASNLSLIQNLSLVVEKYMKPIPTFTPLIRLHPLKQSLQQLSKLRVKILKQRLLDINQRYCIYLKNYDNRCWGYLKNRDLYVTNVQDAKNIDKLISAFKDFYSCSSTFMYQCLCTDEQKISQKDMQLCYKIQSKFHCNINTIPIKILENYHQNLTLHSSRLTEKLITQAPADSYALFEVNVIVLGLALNVLEEKARRYFTKIKNQRKVIHGIEKQMQVISKAPKMDLRKHSKKMFGVTIMDSDQSFSLSKSSQGSRSLDLSTFKYHRRN